VDNIGDGGERVAISSGVSSCRLSFPLPVISVSSMCVGPKGGGHKLEDDEQLFDVRTEELEDSTNSGSRRCRESCSTDCTIAVV